MNHILRHIEDEQRKHFNARRRAELWQLIKHGANGLGQLIVLGALLYSVFLLTYVFGG